MKNLPQIFLLFIFLILTTILVQSCDARTSLKDPSAPATSDMTPIKLILTNIDRRTGDPLNEWYFQIPKAYLNNRKAWNGGQFSILSIEFGLPDFKPQKYSFRFNANKGTPEFDHQMERYERGVNITLYTSNVDEEFRRTNRSKRFEQKYTRQVEKKYGLVHYLKTLNCEEGQKPGDSTNDECIDDGRMYLMSESIRDEPWIELTCGQAGVKPNRGCKVTSTFENLQVIYLFKNKQLGNWREYDEAVKELLRRFFIEKKRLFEQII